MYNESLKRKFIKDYTESDATEVFCVRMFESIAAEEQRLDADVCTWDVQNLKPLVERISGTKSIDRQVKIHILKKYAEWCIANNVAGATMNIYRVNVTGLAKIREQMVSGPDDLSRYLDAVFESEAEASTDSIYRCAYWLAFVGIDKEDSIVLTRESVDLISGTVSTGKGKFPIPKQAERAFSNCATLNAFLYKDKWWPRMDNSLLLSGVKTLYTVDKLKVAMSSKAKRAFDAGLTTKRLSYERVQRSGLFYRMKQREMAGYPVDFTDAADEFMAGREYKLDKSGGTIESVRGRILSDYRKDYKQWKLAFTI